jgi:hypothetical protein
MKTRDPTRRELLAYVGLVAICLYCCSWAVFGADVDSKASKKKNNPKKSRELYVKLVARPTDPSYSGGVPSQMARIFLEVLDDRENKTDIGRNIEDEHKPPIRVMADEGDGPLEFVDKLLLKQFHDLGVKLADKSTAQRIVSVKLEHFWAEEAPDYRGLVRAAVAVTDTSGKVLWTDATQDLMNKMLGDANFQKAISSEQ